MAGHQVFIGGIPLMYASAERVLQAIITTTGLDAIACDVKRPKLSGKPCFAFVTFGEEAEARSCIGYDRLIQLGGRKLSVKEALNPNAHMPRQNFEGQRLKVEKGVELQLGSLTDESEICISWEAKSGNEVDVTGVAFEADFTARKLSFTVQYILSDRPSSTEDVGIEEDPLKIALGRLLQPREKRSEYKMEFLLRDISDVREIVSDGSGSFSRRGSSEKLSFIVEVRHPPRCFCQAAENDSMKGYDCHQGSGREDDEWSRTVDFTGNGSIGRSFCYVLSFSNSQENQATAGELRQKLKEFHLARSPVLSQQLVLNHSLDGFRRGPVQTPEVASFPAVRGGEGVSFHLMFQVQQLVQHGLVAESALARGDFFGLLKPRNRSEEQITERALKEMVGSSAYIFRPVQRLIQIRRKLRKRLGHLQDWSSFSPDLPPSLVSVRRLEVTPTKVLCLEPETAVANRVTRKLAGGDRLMRVTFRDEGGGQLSSKALQSEDRDKRSALYYRMETFLRDGFEVGNRRYSFLAFSTSQVREQAVWFLHTPDGGETADRVRAQLGDFTTVNNVGFPSFLRGAAKCAARMGQCFSDTRATVDFHNEEWLPDIKRNGYCFSDGIGRVSPDLANDMAKSLRICTPSAFQIRYGGCKGVIAVYPPWAGQKRLGLRRSMEKFQSPDKNLEVITHSRFLPAYLNRQVITLLSTLGVAGSAFMDLQDDVVSKLEAMLADGKSALRSLNATCSGGGQWTGKMMLEAGFDPRTEPHLRAMLQTFRAEQLREIQMRARIFVPNGACLLGCLDEDDILEEDEIFVHLTCPEIGDGLAGHVPTWVKTSKASIAPKVLNGEVIVVKNPCLWPGDVRKLTAVDHPELRHHVNTIVFSQMGSRPTPNLCSDGDLDGDKVFVFWEPALVFPGENREPLDYRPQPPAVTDQVTTEDIQHFFLEYMVNDSLGVICNAHVVEADSNPLGASSEECRQLAVLACTAVDYPKSGHPAVLPRELRPQTYPDYMEKEDKPTYKSKSILGQLYRDVKERTTRDSLKAPKVGGDVLVLDEDLSFPGFKEHLEEAWLAKWYYDQELTEIMRKYRIETEAEVVTNCIASLSVFHQRPTKAHKVKERIREAFNAVKKNARNIFDYGLGGVEQEEPRVSRRVNEAEQLAKAYAYYYVTYSRDWRERKIAEGEVDETDPILLSFPWIACDFLGSLKIRNRPY